MILSDDDIQQAHARAEQKFRDAGRIGAAKSNVSPLDTAFAREIELKVSAIYKQKVLELESREQLLNNELRRVQSKLPEAVAA